MKSLTTILLIAIALCCYGNQLLARQVAPVFDEYVQQGDNGSDTLDVIYIRVANGFNRNGYLIFDLNEFSNSTSATLNLAIKDYRANLADPQVMNIFATGSDTIPNFMFSTQPSNSSLDSLGSVTLSGTPTDLTYNIQPAITTQRTAGFRYLVIKIISSTPNAFTQFYSTESTVGPAPFIETDSSVPFELGASNAGYVQENQTTFNTSRIYLRNSAGFNRVGYVSFPINFNSNVQEAKLRLSVENIRFNDPTVVDVTAFEGDITNGLDFANQPTTGGTPIGSVNQAQASTTMEIDVTTYVNSIIQNPNANAVTFQVNSTTNNAFVQFFSNSATTSSDEPALVLISDCLPKITTIDTVLCDGDVLTTATTSGTTTGVYIDSLLATCGADSIINYNATFISNQTVMIDTSICEGDALQIFNGVDFVSYTTAGTYRDSTEIAGCKYLVITKLSTKAVPEPNLGPDIRLIEGNTAILDAGMGFISYLWSTGDTTQTIEVSLGTNAVLGLNTFSVIVTNSENCQGGDEIIIDVQDAALKPFKDAAMREDKNGFWKSNRRIELKNDLYGDLTTPPGVGPFFNRQSYFGYDITGFDSSPVDQAVFRLYINRFSPIPNNVPNEESLEIPVTLNFVQELFEDTLTYPNRYQPSDYIAVQQNVIVKKEDLNTYLEFEITSFFNDEILTKNIDRFTFILTADGDTSSTLLNFASTDSNVDSLRPRIVWRRAVSNDPLSDPVELTISPNPTKGVLNVNLGENMTSYSILDMSGKLMMQGDFGYARQAKIRMDQLPNGIYVIRIRGQEQNYFKKFIKE